MPPTVHILRGPARAGNEYGRSLIRAGKGRVLWLAPNRRRVEQLRGQLGDVPGLWLATFPDLAGAVIAAGDPDSSPLTRCQARALVDEIAADLMDREELARFTPVAETRGFLDAACALLAECQQNDIPPDALDSPLAALLSAYRRLLRERRVVDFEERVSRARDLLRSSAGDRLLPRFHGVLVDDFSDFTTPQIDLLLILAGRVKQMGITLPDEEGDERAELFAASRATAERLSKASRGRKPLEEIRFSPEAYAPGSPGLLHIERHLFRPVRRSPVSDDASGLELIQAPGLIGEARLVARRVKTLLLDGVAGEDVLVAVRDLDVYAELLHEVFDEYGIPVDVEGVRPLIRHPAVALLPRLPRLPDDDWPFADVTALLRNTHLGPDWPEARFDENVPLLSEALLRLLGEPRGRDAYLAAVRRCATEKPRGLEDERAEESRFRRTHELAQRCGPFLERFFACWDRMPTTATAAEHVAWLRGLVADLGLERKLADEPAWRRLWEEVDLWSAAASRRLDRRTFQRRLLALAAEAGLGRTPRGPGRVRVLSADLAATLDVEHLFVLGLGERGFPRLAVPSSLLDESERQQLRQHGLDVACLSDALSREMLLFYRLLTRAGSRLVLSYPAVDEKGQQLLPSSFLSAVLDLFTPGAVPVERRSMPIEGHDRDEPLSPAEYRVRLALASRVREHSEFFAKTPSAHALGSPGFDNLRDAAEVARQRFDSRELGPHEGMFRDPALIAEVARRFGPERVFSPTALEDYVACPFRFFLRHVLRLEPLEDPREEIEVTRRGQAVHRALSRLHRGLKEKAIHRPDEGLEEAVRVRLREAIAEDVARAAGPASKILWELEGERLLRLAGRYPGQWQKLVEPWIPLQVTPEPYHFEVDFGLPAEEGQAAHPPLVIRSGEVEVRISGRIDRVDTAPIGDAVGFWVIDYKTGRGGYYTGPDLARFEKLQLTLYALAVETVLLADRPARPLGLAYWIVSENGPKVVLPGSRKPAAWHDQDEPWRQVRGTLEAWVATLVTHIRQGEYPLRPRSDQCTQTCEFGRVCRISQSRGVEKEWSLPLPVISVPD